MALYMTHYDINSPTGVIAGTRGLLRDAAFILLQRCELWAAQRGIRDAIHHLL